MANPKDQDVPTVLTRAFIDKAKSVTKSEDGNAYTLHFKHTLATVTYVRRMSGWKVVLDVIVWDGVQAIESHRGLVRDGQDINCPVDLAWDYLYERDCELNHAANVQKMDTARRIIHSDIMGGK